MSTEPVENGTAAVEVPVELSKEQLLHKDLQDIFSRASEGMEKYTELGKLSQIAAGLGTDPVQGLASDKVELHRELFGKNELPKEKPITFLDILIGALSDFMVILLIIAAVVSLILGLTVPEPGHDEVDRKKGWIEGFAILLSVTIVTLVSSINDYNKELKFRKLSEDNDKQDVKVIRDGKEVTIDVTEIVVGDVLNLGPGLVTPADAFYIRGESVVIDESAVTGENDPKKKKENAPFILTGTVVNTAEKAWCLVGAVGETSFGGRLMMESRVEGPPPPTPLQDRLDEMAMQIGYMGMGAALLLFIVLAIIEGVRLGNGDGDAQNYLTYFIISVAIVVVAVPEGLPLAVAIALAYSQNKMVKDNNQVRRLKACETMGNATQICSDKTGTLTQNLMSVVQMYVGDVHAKIEKPGEFLEKITLDGLETKEVIDIITNCIGVCSSSQKSFKTVTVEDKDGKREEKKWVWDLDKGNKTDNALLDLVDRLLIDDNADYGTEGATLPHQDIRKAAEETDGDAKIAYFPFTSERKRQSVVIQQEDHQIMYVKGGSDVIFGLCDTVLSADGKILSFDDYSTDIEKKINEFADAANRTVGLAFAKLPKGALPEDEPEVALTWVGLVGIQDPLRPEVPDAVAKCQMAGVTVRMCTGDNLATAVAISKNCGIYQEGRDTALEGKDFRELVYESYRMEHENNKDGSGINFLTEKLKNLTVVARCQPLDKQLLVLTLMLRGEVVAVTGDGTNDAPALKLAHVGFVMKSGTDIAVKSADIVLLDDNFKSVQRAVVWGRTVNDNIRKFLQLQLTVNIVSVLLTFVGSISSSDNTSPLSTVQLLWLNLIMDTFAALALATELPDEVCLTRKPVNKNANLISRRMWCTMLVQSVFQLAMTLSLQHSGHKWFPEGEFEKDSTMHRTLIFNVFVWCVIFNEFNARKLYDEKNIFEGFGRSKPFFIILLITAGFQAFAVEVAGDFMKTSGQTWRMWLCAIGLGLGAWPLGVLSRFIPITEPELEREYDPDCLDDAAQEMVAKLEDDVYRKLGIERPKEDEDTAAVDVSDKENCPEPVSEECKEQESKEPVQ